MKCSNSLNFPDLEFYLEFSLIFQSCGNPGHHKFVTNYQGITLQLTDKYIHPLYPSNVVKLLFSKRSGRKVGRTQMDNSDFSASSPRKAWITWNHMKIFLKHLLLPLQYTGSLLNGIIHRLYMFYRWLLLASMILCLEGSHSFSKTKFKFILQVTTQVFKAVFFFYSDCYKFKTSACFHYYIWHVLFHQENAFYCLVL